MKSDEDLIERVASAAALSVWRAMEQQRKSERKRHYGYNSIRKAIQDLTGCMPSESTLKRWVDKNRFPLDRDASGSLFVLHANLVRWLDATATPAKD